MIYLVRHGETVANVESVYSGQRDDGLSVHGRESSARLGEYFMGRTVNRIVSSPLMRALDTARPISDRTGVPIEVVDELTEIDMGPWTGLSASEIARLFPSAWKHWRTNPDSLRLDGFEGLASGQARIVKVIQEVAERSAHSHTVFVTHETLIRLALCWIENRGLSAYRSFSVPNASVIRISTDQKGNRTAVRIR